MWRSCNSCRRATAKRSEVRNMVLVSKMELPAFIFLIQKSLLVLTEIYHHWKQVFPGKTPEGTREPDSELGLVNPNLPSLFEVATILVANKKLCGQSTPKVSPRVHRFWKRTSILKRRVYSYGANIRQPEHVQHGV